MADDRFVYVVSYGRYSDRYIVTVQSDESIAKAIASHIGGDVESFRMNEDEDRWRAGLRPYDVELYEDGRLRLCVKQDLGWAREEDAWDHLVPARRWIDRYPQTQIAIWMHYVWARSKHQAIELTQARFRREIVGSSDG